MPVPVSAQAVSAASAKGGTVVLSGGQITYTPPSNYNDNVAGPDTFTYTATDQHGDVSTPVTATVTVTVLDTLAAAYAEVGRFSDAIRTIDSAIELGRATGSKQLSEYLERRRALFVAGKPARAE